MNKSEKAISVLGELLAKLSSVSNVLQGNSWKATLQDTLELYIGPKSNISNRLNDIYFTTRKPEEIDGKILNSERHIYDETKKDSFKELILLAIFFINSNGVYKNPLKNNFLAEFKNSEIIPGIVIGIGLIFTSAFFLVDQSKERKISSLNKTIEFKDEEITRLTNVQSDEVKHLDIENKNLWDTYLKIKQENELLKSKIK